VSSPYDIHLESLVSYEVIWCHWVKRFPSNEGNKKGYLLRNRHFTTIGISSVKTVADRHKIQEKAGSGKEKNGWTSSDEISDKPKNWRQTEQNGVNVWPNASVWMPVELRC